MEVGGAFIALNYCFQILVNVNNYEAAARQTGAGFGYPTGGIFRAGFSTLNPARQVQKQQLPHPAGPPTHARSNTAIDSTWAVWGNMFTTPAATQR